jgi:tetratricopeptide (TPR) repeat protein
VEALPAAGKATVAYLQGRALDAATSEYSSAAEDALSRAVRLNPASAEAWAALGHCQWKKNDLASAVESFSCSLKRRPTALALRSLSQLARLALSSSGASAEPADRAAAQLESIERAKAAVALSMTDAASWATLGLAHMFRAMDGTRDTEDLRKAKAAFSKAAQVEQAAGAAGSAEGGAAGAAGAASSSAGAGAGAASSSAAAASSRRNPDLHYNRGVVLSALEEYEEASACFMLAAEIDPSMKEASLVRRAACCAALCPLQQLLARLPLMPSPSALLLLPPRPPPTPLQDQCARFQKRVALTFDIISKKANVRPSRLAELCYALSSAPLNAAEAAQLGGRRPVHFAGLAPGPNAGTYLRVRVLFPIMDSLLTPCSLVAVDAAGAMACLATYHFSQKALASIKDKHSVLLLDPVCRRVSLRMQSSEEGAAAAAAAAAAAGPALEFLSAHAAQPESFLLDGRAILDFAASTAQSSTFDR